MPSGMKALGHSLLLVPHHHLERRDKSSDRFSILIQWWVDRGKGVKETSHSSSPAWESNPGSISCELSMLKTTLHMIVSVTLLRGNKPRLTDCTYSLFSGQAWVYVRRLSNSTPLENLSVVCACVIYLFIYFFPFKTTVLPCCLAKERLTVTCKYDRERYFPMRVRITMTWHRVVCTDLLQKFMNI